jgi:hypothetical protein
MPEVGSKKVQIRRNGSIRAGLTGSGATPGWTMKASGCSMYCTLSTGS